MVIAQKDGIIFVTLSDGELLPENLNSPKVVAFRQGESTDRQMKIIKPLGQLAPSDLVKPPDAPVCNYDETSHDPLHEHADGSWWFYDETWAFENGPFLDYESGWKGLEDYCINLEKAKRKALTEIEESDRITETDTKGETHD